MVIKYSEDNEVVPPTAKDFDTLTKVAMGLAQVASKQKKAKAWPPEPGFCISQKLARNKKRANCENRISRLCRRSLIKDKASKDFPTFSKEFSYEQSYT